MHARLLDLWDRARRSSAELLETGAVPPVAPMRAVARAWDARARRHLGRPLPRPGRLFVIGVGSASLGGAGKTPLCIALARALAASGEPVALVSHGYRSEAGSARLVLPHHATREVGDDALTAARELAADPVRVVSGRDRAACLRLASAMGARIVLVDGLLQASPRLDWSVLVLDAVVGLGSGSPPPLGDLRAFPATLLGACDVVAVIRDRALDRALTPPASWPGRHLEGRPFVEIGSTIAGARGPGGELQALADLAPLRLGLIVSVAHHERIIRSLRARDLAPELVLALSDHARLPARALQARLRVAARGRALPDALLTSGRCAQNLPAEIGGVPVLPLVHRLDPAELLATAPPVLGARTDPRVVQRIESAPHPYYPAPP